MMIEHHNHQHSPLTPGTQASGNSSTYSEETFDNDSVTHASATSSSVGRSHRYKVAMTARARQRRMRRMKDKSSKDTGTEDGDAPLTPSTPTPGRSGGKDVIAVTPDSKKKHVMSTPTQPLAGASRTSSGLKNRYERSLSASRRRSRSKEVPGTTSVVSPMASLNTPEAAKATPKINNVPRSAYVTTPDNGYSDRTSSSKYHITQPPKSERVSPLTPPSSSNKHSFYHLPQSVPRMPSSSSPTPKIDNSFLPTFNSDGLSPQEVRDAHNFTSIQFQCSNLSGEVEMLSGDEFNTPDNDSQDSDLTGNEAAKSFFQNEVWSEASVPSLLQRGEIFHHKAAASIVSLLTPERMFKAGLMAPEGNSEQHEEDCPDVNGDSPTGIVNSPGGLTFDRDDPGISRGVEWNGVEPVAAAGAEEEEAAVRKALTTRMIAPSQQLADLLSQINRDAKTTPTISRAFATRRKNACGALKILSAKEENRLKICWTSGVLNAISSVLADVNTKTVDEMSFNANTEARNRIVSVLLNLSVNKKNRMLICNTEGVLEAITETIVNDNGESRQGCCTVLLYLAKTSETRPMIIRCPGLLDALAKVIEVPRSVVEQPVQVASVPNIGGIPRKMYENRFLKEFETPKTPDENVRPGNMRPEGTMQSQEETISDSEDDSSSVSSASGSGSRDGSKSSSGSEAEESAEHSDEDSETDDEEQETEFVIEHKEMEICFKTPVSKEDEEEKQHEIDYDADENRFLHGSRLSIFACLLCLVKNMENAFNIARAESLIRALIGVSKKYKSPSHPRAIAVLAHLTRHPKNCHHLVFNFLEVLPMLQNATGSDDAEARRYALCSIQNLSMDKSCRAPIAHTPKMIASLTERCNSESKEEVLAAVASLQNLSDEPANLIQFTIVKNCIGTIISIARSDEARRLDGIETDLTQFMAKNTLATISFWFRKIATSGSQRMSGNTKEGGGPPRAVIPLYDAVLKPTDYEQWV